jgi:hypothetical protein
MGVTLSAPLVIALIGAVAIWKDAKRGWVWLTGAMFGVAIAGSAFAVYIRAANDVSVDMVNGGVEVVNEKVSGGGPAGQ